MQFGARLLDDRACSGQRQKTHDCGDGEVEPALLVRKTPEAAAITARLSIVSKRLHSYTERMLASPSRQQAGWGAIAPMPQPARRRKQLHLCTVQHPSAGRDRQLRCGPSSGRLCVHFLTTFS